MLLASMAYTFLAPAWMAKKDRMPEPAPTSNTTWKYNKQEKGRIALKELGLEFIYQVNKG